MAAALDIMGTQGLPATTVTGICAQARVGPRFFYDIFHNLEAITLAVIDEILDTATARALEAIAAANDDIVSKVRAAVETMVSAVTDDPRRARVVFVEAYGSPAMTKRRNSALRGVADIMAGLLPTVVELPDTPSHFGQAISLILTGGIAELVLAWVDDSLSMSRDDLINTCVEMMITTAANAPTMATRLNHG
jgi:AcrR family transcriptional regulator